VPEERTKYNGRWTEVTVAPGQTATAWGSDLFISLVKVSYEGDPLSYKVYANVGAPSQQNMAINQATVGAVFTYRREFDIRVTSADAVSATFHVTRKSG
jgi:hypothetical protein